MMPPDDSDYFFAIPWCRAFLENASYARTTGISRKSHGTTYDTLFSETLNTANTIPAILSLETRPAEGMPVTETLTFVSLGSGMNGYVDTSHGGAIATILDEVAGFMVRVGDPPGGNPQFPIVTAYLHVDYLMPVQTPQVVLVKAKVALVEGRKKKIDLQMFDHSHSESHISTTGDKQHSKLKSHPTLLLGKLNWLHGITLASTISKPGSFGTRYSTPTDSPHILKMHQKTVHDSILANLQGATVKVPGLLPLFNEFPSGTNIHLDKLTNVVDRRIASFYPNDPEKVRRLKKSDFALFAATWWPHVEFHRLVILAYYSLWLFLWDDEVDSSTGMRYDNLEETKKGHAEALSYISHCLGLDHGYPKVTPTDPVTLSFKDIGDALCQDCDAGVEEEQRLHLDNIWPSVDEYVALRRGTGAVMMTVALDDYSVNRKLPERTQTHPAVRDMCERTDTDERYLVLEEGICAYYMALVLNGNPAYKVQKQGALFSYIPVAYAVTGDLQKAVDMAVFVVEEAIRKFKLAK
ncbi:hypothetical protein FE257_000241 [Aspergillus nanangensis]|uniref:Thioesterase domain-containing protein n=1 Tax=Aspergillus nanangensis TaxID=2582783 RepID=A0AAD4D105_ASPNN|nr:hypothetical protein FE257_000241 [Aspergillus nanangensis]